MARILKHMGFESLAQVDLVIGAIDDDAVSRSALWSAHGVNYMRFETMLTAGMGHDFIVRHLWNTEAWFIVGAQVRIIETLMADGLFDGSRPLPLGTRPKREPLGS